ncbi:hypothetical protein GJ496_003112 [Pomphorhynchus laevis]|nr:hypothetical protein GJ496_003112 [Pomphorhynchus laevis]
MESNNVFRGSKYFNLPANSGKNPDFSMIISGKNSNDLSMKVTGVFVEHDIGEDAPTEFPPIKTLKSVSTLLRVFVSSYN